MEKGLSYFDLAENDYQFLLKIKRRPYRKYDDSLWESERKTALPYLSVQIFFSVFQKHPCGQNYCHQFGGRICKPDSGNARRAGRARRQMIIKTKDLVKASTADTIPLFRAVNIPLAKILNPINKSAVVQMRFPVTAS